MREWTDRNCQLVTRVQSDAGRGLSLVARDPSWSGVLEHLRGPVLMIVAPLASWYLQIPVVCATNWGHIGIQEPCCF